MKASRLSMQAFPLYCTFCGANNQAQSAFCFYCGKAIQIGKLSTVQQVGGTGRLAAKQLLKQRYIIIRLLGQGGMGAVYRAEDTLFSNRPVAVKEMSQSNLNPQELIEAINQFKQEAYLLAALKHSNLPSIYDHFSENGRWYLVMDFIEGETIAEYLNKAKGRVLPIAEVLDIGVQLCKVLGYLHTRWQPIIFRDLKPSNIMLTPDGHLYLIDFGIARFFKPGQVKDTVAYGSAGYTAPEQFGRAQTTARSDIYSLGATLHQLLSGKYPASNTPNPFHFEALQTYNPAIPQALAMLVMQMLEMNVTHRPAEYGHHQTRVGRYPGTIGATCVLSIQCGHTPTAGNAHCEHITNTASDSRHGYNTPTAGNAYCEHITNTASDSRHGYNTPTAGNAHCEHITNTASDSRHGYNTPTAGNAYCEHTIKATRNF